MSYGRLDISGCGLGNISSHGGVPKFSATGLGWIREKTGDPHAFDAAWSERVYTPDLQASSTPLQAATDFPSRNTVERCLDVFSTSPLRLIWPVVDMTAFPRMIQLAYTDSEHLRVEAQTAKICILAFVAFMTILHPALVSGGAFNPRDCAKQALSTLFFVVEHPTLESFQAALTLAMYYDFSGQLQMAHMLHSLACRCLFMLNGHLKRKTEEIMAEATSDASQTGQSSWEHLRGLFWLCYFFDKHISLRTGQPPCIDDDQCDLILPDGYQGLCCANPSLDISTNTKLRPVWPGDLGLAIIKSKVYRKLYSSPTFKKTDACLLKDIRELDDELENWRESLPSTLKPSLSSTQGLTPDIMQHPFGMKVVFAHLEYLHLVAAIHRACGRCRIWSTGEGGEVRAISSSLTVAIQASRSTLIYLKTASKLIHSESFWLVIFYPTWSALIIFFNILRDPLDKEASRDIELLQYIPDLFKMMRSRQLSQTEESHLKSFGSFIEEVVRLAKLVIRRDSMQLN
ncbi:hypothetical protein NM208_g2957 [Fusarium decemcellulare]|uniref:Uncharacterized protein n=1 Tax=Fusarium decemcellulare TaxID=57161 RepID=A0ACC1SQU5_9HYPO|nr:hypothetical protein NM208_g2957 [Fusarium decemcellulare]